MNIFLHLLYYIVEMFNYILAYRFLFGITLTHKKKYFVLFFSGILIVQYIALYFDLNTDIINILYGILIPLFLLDDKYSKKFVLYPSVLIITSIITIVTFYFICVFTKENQVIVMNNPAYTLLSNSTFPIVLLFFAYFFKKKKKQNGILIGFTNFQYILLTISLFSCICIIGTIQGFSHTGDIPFQLVNLYGLFLALLCISFIIILVCLSISIRDRKRLQHQKEIANLRMQKQEQKINLIRQSDNEIRRFRHDIRKHLSLLQNYIDSGDLSEANAYLTKIGTKYEQSKPAEYTGIIAIDAIIEHYKMQMDNAGIRFEWYSGVNKRSSSIDIFDMCTIFDNILSNAVEACEKLETNAEIYLSIDGYNTRWCIIEKNRICEPLCYDELGNPVTTKPDIQNHGFGSQNIREVVKKYNGTIEYKSDSEWFEIILII
ncbi:MAG: sensor histidine kinase [Coprococcus sp.]